jgi:hypothetical protein
MPHRAPSLRAATILERLAQANALRTGATTHFFTIFRLAADSN